MMMMIYFKNCSSKAFTASSTLYAESHPPTQTLTLTRHSLVQFSAINLLRAGAEVRRLIGLGDLHSARSYSRLPSNTEAKRFVRKQPRNDACVSAMRNNVK